MSAAAFERQLMRDEAVPVSKRFRCESAFSLPRWLVGLVTPNESDARWAETALGHRVMSPNRLHQNQIARFKITLSYRQIIFENDRYRYS